MEFIVEMHSRIDERSRRCSFELMEPSPEQIASERARLEAILAKERPRPKPGSRNTYWEAERYRAREALIKLNRGEWRPASEDDCW
jgi:hypothetical protein